VLVLLKQVKQDAVLNGDRHLGKVRRHMVPLGGTVEGFARPWAMLR
jgi:hypothetical protein